jgi:hypothetical protein
MQRSVGNARTGLMMQESANGAGRIAHALALPVPAAGVRQQPTKDPAGTPRPAEKRAAGPQAAPAARAHDAGHLEAPAKAGPSVEEKATSPVAARPVVKESTSQSVTKEAKASGQSAAVGTAGTTTPAPASHATATAGAGTKALASESTEGKKKTGNAAKGENEAAGETKESAPSPQEAIAPAVHAIHQRTARARKHSEPASIRGNAEAAALVPATERTRSAARNTVHTLDTEKEKSQEVQSEPFKKVLTEAILAATTPKPTTKDKADEMMKTGGKQASAVLGGELSKQSQAAAGTLVSTSEHDAAATPGDIPEKTDLKPEIVGAPPAPVSAAPVVPASLPAERLDYSADRGPTDNAMADAGVTKSQLEEGNEPAFNQTIEARSTAEKNEANAEAHYRQSEAKEQQHAYSVGHKELGTDLAAIHGVRGLHIGDVASQQTGTRDKHAKEHQHITDEINRIKTETQKAVNEILKPLETEAAERFERGLAVAEEAYETTFKEEKGGVWNWVSNWGDDWEELIENSLTKARAEYMHCVRVAINAIAEFVDGKLKAAKKCVADGLKQVETFVSNLDKSLIEYGTEILDKVSGDFATMTTEIDQRGEALAGKLAGLYKASYERMNAREEQLREENKSLWRRIYDATVGLIKKILAFKDMLLGILAKAVGVIGDIIAHPIRFLGNLVDGVMLGLKNFKANLATHLKKGLMEWIFGALGGAGLTLPDKFDLEGIISIVLQVLGLTYSNFRARAVAIVGEPVVGALEKTAEVFKVIITEGIPGLWRFIKEKLNDLKSMVVDAILDFIKERVIIAGVTWVIGLLNPASAFFKACKAIYDIVMFFINHGSQILALVNAIVDSMAAIARGSIDVAAKWIEDALAKTIPLAIGFLASLLGLGDISDTVKKIIDKAQAPINAAIDWVINQAVKLVKAVGGFLGVGKKEDKKSPVGFDGEVGKDLPWTAEGQHHHMWIVSNGTDAIVMMESDAKPVAKQLEEYTVEAEKLEGKKKKTALAKITAAKNELKKLDTKADELTSETKKSEPDHAKAKSEEKGVESEESTLVELLKEVQEELGLSGNFGTEQNPIPLAWPKRRLLSYPTIYIGPEVTLGGEGLEQSLLEKGDRPAIKNKLTIPQAEKWESDGHPILACRPEKDSKLPDGTGIGIVENRRLDVGVKIMLTKSYSTGGGGKINRALKPYGFRPDKEGKDGDHILERQMGGEDELSNLWPLEAGENRGGGSSLSQRVFKDPKGKEIPISDLKDKATTAKPVWFQITSTKS